MPVHRKRAREGEQEKKEVVSNSKKQKKNNTKVLYEYDNIGYSDDQWHTLKRSIPLQLVELTEMMSSVVGSFINGAGGVLCFGCRPNGKIYGEEVNREEEDNLRLIIDDMMKKFHPFVSPKQYRIYFTPVEPKLSKFTSPRVILEIKVERGNKYELYETEQHQVYLRKDGKPYGPLTPHEIKRHVVQQYKMKLEDGVKLRNNLRKFQHKKKGTAKRHSQGGTSKDPPTTSQDTPINKGPPHPLSVCKKSPPASDVMKTTMIVPDPNKVTVTITSSSSVSTVGIPLPQCTTAHPTVTTTVTHKTCPNIITATDSSLKTTATVIESNSDEKTKTNSQNETKDTKMDTKSKTQTDSSKPTVRKIVRPSSSSSTAPHNKKPLSETSSHLMSHKTMTSKQNLKSPLCPHSYLLNPLGLQNGIHKYL